MKLLKSSFVYVMLGFLPVGINFLLSPLYSHVLSPEQNAILGIATVFQGFLTVFLGLSIDSAFVRLYFDYYKDKTKLREYTSSVLLFMLAFGLVAFLLLLPFGNRLLYLVQKNKSFSFSTYGTWVFATTFCTTIQSLFLAYYRNAEKLTSYSIVSLLFFFTSLTLTLIGLLVFKAGALGSIVGRSIAYMAVSFVLLLVFFYRNGMVFKIHYIKESLHYSLPIVPYLLMMVLYGNIDRIVIEHYFLLKDLGIYNFAFLISGAVSVFISSTENVLKPMIYRLLGETVVDGKKINRLFRFFHFGITGIICAGLFMAFIFIKFFIAPDYHSILNYIGVLFLAYIFRMYYVLYVDGLFFYKKTKWIFLITLASFIIGLLSNFLLIPLFGILGVCISVMIINLVQAMGAYLQISIYRINMNFYDLGPNHRLTFFIIAAYFSCMILFNYAGIDMQYVNLVPLVAFTPFCIILLFQNKTRLGNYMTEIKKGILRLRKPTV